MLKIESSKQLVAAMQLARETKTEDQLIDKLLYLDEWYGKETTVVKIWSSLPSSPGFIEWAAHRINAETHEPEEETFYNGGLVFNEASNEWGIHS